MPNPTNKNKFVNTSKAIDAKRFELSNDSDSEVDGVHILAKVSGPAFFPNEIGGNGRVYSDECWIKTLEDENFIKRLEDRTVFGSIGHEIEVDDDTIRNGLISHVVTKMWLDEETNVGMAEYLVLNTEPGKVLNTLLRAKCKLSVSTLASGTTTDVDGIEYADPETFAFERIDFVINPSYNKAVPTLLESLQTLDTLKQNAVEDTHMPEINTKDAQKLGESLAKAESQLQHYQELGSVKQLTEDLAELKAFREIGENPIFLAKTLSESQNIVDGVAERQAALEAANQAFKQELKLLHEGAEEKEAGQAEVPADFKQLLEEADEAKAELAKWKELGDSPEEAAKVISEAQEAVEELAQFKEITEGASPEEVKELIENVKTLIEEDNERKFDMLAESSEVDPAVIDKLRAKGLSLEDIQEIISDLKPTTLAEEEEDGEDVEIDAEVDDENQETKALSESEDEDDEEDLEKDKDESEESDEEDTSKSLGESLNTTVLRRLAESRNTVTDKSKKTTKQRRTLAESLIDSRLR